MIDNLILTEFPVEYFRRMIVPSAILDLNLHAHKFKTFDKNIVLFVIYLHRINYTLCREKSLIH